MTGAIRLPGTSAHFSMLSDLKEPVWRDEAGGSERRRNKSTHHGVVLPAVTGVLTLLMAG